MQTAIPHPAQETTTADLKVSGRRAMLGGLEDEYGIKVPAHLRDGESPKDMLIAYLVASGRTQKEIAELTNLSPQTISQITHQPYFRKRLKEICETAGKDMVKSYLEGQVMPSLEVLTEIRDNEKEKGATRVSACSALLDRFLGKPTVHVEASTNLNIHTAAAAADQVKTELSRINEELRQRGVLTSAN